MDRLSFLVFLACLCFVYATIKIKELNVPDSIEYTGDSTDEIVMDCNYETEGEVFSEVEVIWYHKSLSNPIYQWIPVSNKKGEARGDYKNHIDVDYRTSDDNSTMYRGLRLTNITMALTGNYTCRVSTTKNEVEMTKPLVVYSPPKAGLEIMVLEDDKQVVCIVEGVYPEPMMNIYITGDNDTIIDLEESSEIDKDSEGFYNITTKHHFANLTKIIDSSSVEFVCTLSIPGTNYSLMESVTYDTDVEIFKFMEEEEQYLSLNDDFNSTEESLTTNETTKGSSAIVHLPMVYLTVLLGLLLVASK